jgi:hypothetical protein
MARARPRLAPALEMNARYAVRGGALVPEEFVFAVEEPLRSALRLDGWMVPLVARLTGAATVEEVHRSAVTAGETPPDFPVAAFVDLAAGMVEKGFLEVELPG